MKKSITAIAIAGAALALAPSASASPLSYIQRLNNDGIYIYDTSSALATGYAICDALGSASPALVTYNLYTHTSYSDVPNVEVAAIWVSAAMDQLCLSGV